MALRIPHCATCPGACELTMLPAISGEDWALKLSLRDMPVFECAKKHKNPVHRDFMLWLIRQICSAKELHAHVPAAIVRINDAAGFLHSG